MAIENSVLDVRSWLIGFVLGMCGYTYPYSVPYKGADIDIILEVDGLWASTLPTTATLYLVDDEAYVTDETAITSRIGEAGLKLRLNGSNLFIEV